MNGATKVLVAEDDPNLGLLLKEYLEIKGFQVNLCEDGEIAWGRFKKESFDICILDVMMPKMDGFSLAKEIRKINEEVPILFLTAKSMKEDKIKGFQLGADDYLTKPFSMEELQLRIEAVLRRYRASVYQFSKQTKFSIGKYDFDYDLQHLKWDEDGHRHLTSKEAQLLRLFCEKMNEVTERSLALKLIWNEDTHWNARSMDVYITRLRQYLKEDPSVQIKNIHGKGYRLLTGLDVEAKA